MGWLLPPFLKQPADAISDLAATQALVLYKLPLTDKKLLKIIFHSNSDRSKSVTLGWRRMSSVNESLALGCLEKRCMMSTVDFLLTASLWSRSRKGKTSESQSICWGKKEVKSTRLRILTDMKGWYDYLKDANVGKQTHLFSFEYRAIDLFVLAILSDWSPN